ncbi:MAG: hypothetical protein LBC38_04140 [Oscillospiraceae bacterium]|jgi:formate C-acetyltransferase|nr:hypothetical protein [Oscillospiraceae bacterium]
MYSFAPISPRIKRIREKRDAFTHGKDITINTERTKLYTDYYRQHMAEQPLLRRSGALLYWAANREINVFDDDIIVGTPGPQERCLSVYVDTDPSWIRGVIDKETFKQAWQSGGAIYMSDEQRDTLEDALDLWQNCSISAVLAGSITEDFYEAFGNGACMGGWRTPDGKWLVGGGIQGHYVANFDKVVKIGFAVVKEDALELIEQHRGQLFGDSAKKQIFRHAVVRVCDAYTTLAKRYAEACRAKAKTAPDEARELELLSMADSLEWISENNARTYREGLQSIILYQLLLSTDAQQHGQSMGRVDKYVGFLLDRDLRNGTITLEQAQEYTDAFVLRICDIMVIHGMMLNNQKVIELNKNGMNAYMAIYNGMTATGGIVLTVGGVKPNGDDDSNEVTKLILQTYGRMKIPDPTVALRVNSRMPEDVWRLAIESSKICGGMPQLENDEIIIPALVRDDFDYEDACNYSIVGCVEPGGTGNEWSASGNDGQNSVWNMMNVIQLVINGGVNPATGVTALPCKKLYEYDSFEELQETFVKQMQYVLDWTVSFASVYELAYSQNFPCIVASSMMDGCLESGKDVTEGGAKYNRTGLTAAGTANVADSLMAIKKLCFDDKTVTLRELYDALQANWEGYEQLRQTIINKVPHYGNNIDEVDELAAWSLETFADILKNERGPRGRYCGGTFTVTAHIMLGAQLGATPDGRMASEPIADAINSRQGFDVSGPTAALFSAAKLPHMSLSNGDQLNIRFSPSSVAGDEGAEKLKALLSTYFDIGGMQAQFNVVSTENLREAQKNPLEHKDLIVRIAGFSTYFVTLDRAIQEDFISRTEQSL